jgi:hypothetical protein
MGLISSVAAGRRDLQVQTELIAGVPRTLRSLVLVSGTALMKRQQSVSDGASRQEVEELLRTQHAEVESEVRNRLACLARTRVQANRDTYYRLVEQGLAAYGQRDYAEALHLWRQARELASDGGALSLYIRAAEKEMS